MRGEELKIDGERIRTHIETISSFNATPGRGCTRFSFSPEDREARGYITGYAESLGLQADTDFAGNLHIRYPGAEAIPPILAGSHLDTVYQGGRYDGLLGVAAALEILRVLTERQASLRHPFEVLAFAEEEGSNFGQTMLGSKLLTGMTGISELNRLRNREGVSAWSIMTEFLGEPETQGALANGAGAGFLELHIEQSSRLWDQGKQIGIVERIVGIENCQVRIKGRADHAGAVDMAARKDALAAAAAMMQQLRNAVCDLDGNRAVITFGNVDIRPNIPNIVSEQVDFVIDFRSGSEEDFRQFDVKAGQAAAMIEKEYGVGIEMSRLSRTPVVELSKQIRAVIEEMASEYNLSHLSLDSGAVHDCAVLAQHMPSAIIFIPSKDGRSHCPQEFSRWEDIYAGSQLLLDTLLEMDGIL